MVDNADEVYCTSLARSQVVQEREGGKANRWIEIPAEGKKADDYKSPAPGVKLRPKATDMTWLRHILCILVLVCGFASGRAEAHASLIEAIPADGAVVATALSSVQLRFNEPISPIRLLLTDVKAIAHQDLKPEAHDGIATLTLPGDLPQGTQVVSYRVISSDSHPVAGSIVFSIGVPTAVSREQPISFDEPVAVAIWLVRLALYIGLFAGAGGAFFTLWIAAGATPRAAVQVVCGAVRLGLGATILSVGLQGLNALGASFPLLISLHP